MRTGFVTLVPHRPPGPQQCGRAGRLPAQHPAQGWPRSRRGLGSRRSRQPPRFQRGGRGVRDQDREELIAQTWGWRVEYAWWPVAPRLLQPGPQRPLLRRRDHRAQRARHRRGHGTLLPVRLLHRVPEGQRAEPFFTRRHHLPPVAHRGAHSQLGRRAHAARHGHEHVWCVGNLAAPPTNYSDMYRPDDIFRAMEQHHRCRHRVMLYRRLFRAAEQGAPRS